MKKIILLPFFALCFFSLSLPTHGEKAKSNKIKMVFASGEVVIINLNGSPLSNGLLSRLPMTLDFKDYVGEEKISYLPQKLNSAGISESGSGDFAYYAPWGNLAIFYNRVPAGGRGLYILGVIESGKDVLASMKGDFSARLEAAE